MKAKYLYGSLWYFLFPFPVLAASEVFLSASHIMVFLLGVSLPVIAFYGWKIWRGRKNTLSSPPLNVPQATQPNYHYDLKTHLPTTQQALKQFDQALKADKESRFAAVVFKPINFQQVNTVLGHHNSDILLLQLAYCLKKSAAENPNLLNFEQSPTVVKLARLQGLDFLVIFDLSTTKHNTNNVIDDLCQKLTKAVPTAMSFKSFSLNFELAFGVAISGEHGNNVDEIVSHATDALLVGISNEQSIQYFDNSSVLYTEQQLCLMENLRQDILSEQLRWYLQPQIHATSHAIIGFQLKVHWYVNDEEPLELGDFIDLAEHSGEAYLLTKQMFKQALRVLFTLHKLGEYQKVSVSLSSKSLLEPELVDYIEQQMQNYNIAGEYLMIELNEQVMLSSGQRAKNIIDQLKSLNIEIAIDNFSGSYESLRYLRKMAIHQVKINCKKLDDNPNNRAEKAIINALITLARSMSLPLVGTNIDKQETANSYTSMGGILLQGNMISRGVVPEELAIWFKRWREQYPNSQRL